MPLKTPVEQGFIDAFHAVIIVNLLQGERKLSLNVRKGVKYPAISGIQQRAFLDPP
jgi:hypothetical protein